MPPSAALKISKKPPGRRAKEDSATDGTRATTRGETRPDTSSTDTVVQERDKAWVILSRKSARIEERDERA